MNVYAVIIVDDDQQVEIIEQVCETKSIAEHYVESRPALIRYGKQLLEAARCCDEDSKDFYGSEYVYTLESAKAVFNDLRVRNDILIREYSVLGEPTVKENDQQAKSDAGKPKLTLVPRQIIFDIARIREYGNAKYPEGGPDNWKSVDIQRYRDAAFRHFMAYLDDPAGVDAESGLPHLAHLACNIAFLCEMEKENLA